MSSHLQSAFSPSLRTAVAVDARPSARCDTRSGPACSVRQALHRWFLSAGATALILAGVLLAQALPSYDTAPAEASVVMKRVSRSVVHAHGADVYPLLVRQGQTVRVLLVNDGDSALMLRAIGGERDSLCESSSYRAAGACEWQKEQDDEVLLYILNRGLPNEYELRIENTQ
jgi:hypothetical protein